VQEVNVAFVQCQKTRHLTKEQTTVRVDSRLNAGKVNREGKMMCT
jgi:hypothetical protein